MHVSFLILGIVNYFFSLLLLAPQQITVSSAIKHFTCLAFSCVMFILALR